MTVAARIDDEVRRRHGAAHVRGVPAVRPGGRSAPGAVRAQGRRVVLAGAVAVVAEPPPALLRVIGESDAVGYPGRVLREVRCQLEIGDVHEEALRVLAAALREP